MKLLSLSQARHFKVTQRCIHERVYKSLHLETIEYCIKKDSELKKKKQKAVSKLKSFAKGK